MDTPLSRKELTRDRIVATTARAIRRSGYDGTGVADLMKEAGLTHGGFYAHFPSRSALLAEAVQRASRDGFALLQQAMRGKRQRGAGPLRALIESYLADAHVAHPELGCPIAALAGEMPRQAPEVQQASAVCVRELIDHVRDVLPPQARPDAALLISSALVGALQLARGIGSKTQAKALLAEVRRSLLAQYDSD